MQSGVMMDIETVDEIVEQIADWCGIYGNCRQDDGTGSVKCTELDVTCCRLNFVMEMPDRIRRAVDNEKFLKTRSQQ